MTTIDVPKWLLLQERIDRLYFCLSELQKSFPKSGLEAMIDDTTGHDRARHKRIRVIAKSMKKFKAAMTEETGEEYSTEMEDALLSVPMKR